MPPATRRGLLALQRRPCGGGRNYPVVRWQDRRAERQGKRRGLTASGGDREGVPEALGREEVQAAADLHHSSSGGGPGRKTESPACSPTGDGSARTEVLVGRVR
jgi:hypothetical protein